MTTETTDSNTANITPTIAQLLALAQEAILQRRSTEAAGYCKQLLAQPHLSNSDTDSVYAIYCRALDDLLQYDEILRQVEQWATATQTPTGSIDALIVKGRTLRRKGEVEPAMRLLDEAVALAAPIHYTTAITTANRYRADIMLTLGDADRALALTRQSLRINEEAQDVTGQIETLTLLQIIYSVMGQFYKAIQVGLKGEKLCDITDNRSARYLIYNNLGESYQGIYATDYALRYHRQA